MPKAKYPLKSANRWTKKLNKISDPKNIKITASSIERTNDPTIINPEAMAKRIAKMNLVKLQKWITAGRKRKYSPQELLKKINEYFFMNMIFEEVIDQKTWKVVDYKYKRMKATSIYWLCNFLEITYNLFKQMSLDEKYTAICLQAKQKIMDNYIVGWLEWEYNPRVSSIIVNMQMQNDRIVEWLEYSEEKSNQNLFQNIQINVLTKKWEEETRKIEPIKIINKEKEKNE